MEYGLKRSGTQEDVIRAKRMRNDVKDLIRRAKKDFIQEELVRDETAAKKFWEKNNHLLPSKGNGNTICLIDKENNAVVNEAALPDFVNPFYTNIGPKLASHFPDNWAADLPAYNVDVDVRDMEKLVKDINACKASSGHP